MTKLILKAVSSPKSAASAAVDQVVGQVDTASGAQRLSISAQANTQYRLVDSKTGQVIKNQTVVRKGKTLQIEVDGKNVAELDNFFPDEANDAAPQAQGSTYLVDTSATAEPSYGVVSAQSPAGDMVGESSVMWTPGMPALPLSEPVAFGAQVLSALSGISTAGGVALATGVAVVAGSNLDGTDAAGGTQSAGPKVNGSVVAGPVVGQGLVAGLKVQAFDDKGNSLGTADVKADGSFALELSSPNYKGVLVLKVYDDPNDSLTPKYMDEATGKEKSFDTPLLAVVNYSGDAITAQTVNVTPLSHLAALVAGVGTSSNNTVTVPSNLDKNAVQTANIQVAQKFGLVVDDLTSAEVITSDKNTVNDYGRALALWSQMELSNDKTTSDIADTLKSSITTGNNSDLSTLLQKVNDDNTIAIKNIGKGDLTYVSDNLTDTTEPFLSNPPDPAAFTSSDGSKIFIYFDSLLSKNTADISAFKVQLTTLGTNGNPDTTSDAVISNVSIDGDAVVLTLSPNTRVQEGQKISVSYTDPDPTAINDLFALQDATGNDANPFSQQNVVNKVSANPPVIKVKPDQVFTYAENQTAKTIVPIDITKPVKVVLGDGSAAATKFRFADSQSSVSSDGWYSIDSNGNISFTNVGLSAGKASNDFETKFNGGNTMTYMVQAGDVTGYWSDPVEITLKVADALDPPTLSTPRLFTVTEDLSSHLLFDSNTFAYNDTNLLTVTLSVTDGTITATSGGDVTVGGTGTARTFSGTVADLNAFFTTAGNITYTSAANSNGVRELTVTVGDGTNSTTSKSTLRIQAVNDAPVASGSATLAAVAEDTREPAGATVLGLFIDYFSDTADAVTNGSSANSLAGVAITANTADAATQGKWQWQAHGTTTWTDIATTGLADATALYLAANTSLRFVPAANYSGTPGGLTARLVESNGNDLTNGNVVDVSANGGSTAFSANSVSLGTSITSVNDAPTLTMAPSSYTVNEDAVVDLTFTGTPFTDIDSSSLTVTLSVADGTINATSGGNVTVGGTGTARTFSGTAADLNAFFTAAGKITYQGAANVNGSRILTVTVNDGQSANNTATTTSTINITAVNDAPVASGSATLAAVAEDSNDPAGATVLDLFSDNFSDSKDHVTNGSSANSLAGVAITANTADAATQGKWQWKADGSSTWNDIATTGLADATALYLAANSLIRFVPVADYKGTPGGLTARLVESSGNSLTNGNVVDVSANGGSTAFSANSVSLGTSVVDINDPPVVNIPQSFTMNEDAVLDLVFTGTPFSDNENARLTVTLSVTDGTINATSGGNVTVGGTATARTFTGTADDLNAFFTTAGKITYQGAAHVNGSRTLTVTVDDGSNANNIATATSTINITAVNDKPQVIVGRSTVSLAPVTEDATNPAGATVGNLFGTSFTDGLDAVPNGSSANLFAGIGITQVASTASQGTWQYSADGTTGWTDIPVTGPDVPSATNVYYFQASTYLRFKPAADFNGTPGAITAYLIEENNSGLTRFTTVNHDYFSVTPVTLTTSVTPVNDAPVASGNVTLAAVNEDTTSPAGALVSTLFASSFSDTADAVTNGSSANTLAGVAITANTANANTQGKWQYTDANNAWVDIPTTASLSGAIYVRADAKIRFLPAANFNGSPPALTVKLVDNSPPAIGTVNSGITTDTSNPANTQFSTSTITLGTSITAVNDTPTISAPTSFTVNEDVAGNLLFTGTPFTDIDTNSLTVTLSVAGTINATTGGNVTVGGAGTARTFSGTVAALNTYFTTAGNITYQGAANVNGSRTLTVTVNDGQSANNTASTTSTINITAVNDAPVASGSATLTAVAEDTSNPAGALVSTLFTGRFSDTADTVTNGSSANTLAGVAITANAATAAQGKWQWKANGTTLWTDIAITGLADATALYLAANTSLRFVPVANFNGTPGALTARLVDSSATGLTNGTSANVLTNGGTSAYSSATVSLGTNITAVNDAPVASGSATLAAVVEDTTNPAGALVSTLFASRFSDVDGNTLAGVVITANAATAAQGKWQWKANGTTLWTDIAITGLADATALYLAANTSLRFVPVANFNGTPGALTARLVDSSATGLTNGTSANVSTNGGTSAYSSATVSLGTNITASNDLPTGTVTVSGSVSVGSLLTANNSLVDIDGLGTISYKWEVLNGTTWTSVGTGTTYTPLAVDVGKSLRLTASYTDVGGTAESVSSSAFTVAPIDTQAPMVQAVNISNSALSLTFNEALIGSTGAPLASAFTLNKYNTSNAATNIAITSVEHPLNVQTNAPINDQFKLNYASQILVDSANPYIKLSYTDPTTGNDTKALQDSTGNDMPSFNLFVYNLNANSATGTNAVDYIMGGAGNDTITGGLGNDVLWGLDTFTTGAASDNDSFVWALGDAGATGAVDIVKDFVAWNGTAGDKLNITSLLAGGYNTSTSTLSQWVTVTTGQTVPGSATANSTKIVIDVDGLGAGTVTQTIWLEGVTLSTTDAAALKASTVLIA